LFFTGSLLKFEYTQFTNQVDIVPVCPFKEHDFSDPKADICAYWRNSTKILTVTPKEGLGLNAEKLTFIAKTCVMPKRTESAITQKWH
jgi:hypothetical protein